MKHTIHLALAATLVPSITQAQTFVAPAAEPVSRGSATVEELFDSSVIEGLFPVAPFVLLDKIALLPTGNAVVGVESYNLQAFQYVYVIAHIDLTSGAVDVLVSANEFDELVPLDSEPSLDALDVAPNGDIYLAASESSFGDDLETSVVVKIPWNGSPALAGPATVVASYDTTAFNAQTLIAIDDDGTVNVVRDGGEPAGDQVFFPDGNGVYLLNESVSPSLLPFIGFDSLAMVLSGGGPALTGAVGADAIGINNFEAAAGSRYFTFSDTSNFGFDDVVDGEVYDGDIVALQAGAGLRTLVSRADLVAAYTDLIPDGLGVYPVNSDIDFVDLAVDHERNRLYTLLMTIKGTPGTGAGQNGHNLASGILQWDLRTGAFEGVVASSQDLSQPWADDGQAVVAIEPGYVSGPWANRNSLAIDGDGTLVVALTAPAIFEDTDKILRITPAGL